MAKVFIDTNILVYSLDKHDLNKLKTSRDLLKTVRTKHEGVISTQVLQEFYVASTKKLKADPIVVKEVLKSFEHLEIVLIDPQLIMNAIDINMQNKISFWDALIIAAAAHANCELLWTEDLNPGQIIRGVEVINPYQTE